MNANLAYDNGASVHVEAEVELSQYLAFTLERDTFCLPLQQVREIIQYRDVASVPMMPGYVRGVINLRGSVIPVIDLAARFGTQARLPGRRAVILILEVMHDQRHHTYGLIVDSVSQVLDLSTAQIDAAPAFGTHVRTEFIAGVAKYDGQITLILEAGAVLLVGDQPVTALI